MGYVLRVRFAPFFTGAAAPGFYILRKDYHNAHQSISEQTNGFNESLNGRISALEILKEVDAAKCMEATE